MKSLSITRAIALQMGLLLATCTLLSACREEDKKPRGGQTTISDTGSPRAGAPRNDGTSDPGGGTGVRGKAFENYIKDPKTIRGFAQFIKPVLENYDREDEKKNPSRPGEAPSSLMDYFLVKKWYVLPLAMNCVDKDVIGVSFATDEIDVLACQTDGEVWIDDQKTNASGTIKNPKYPTTDREVAKLIMHEFVMQVYTTRFKKWSVFMKEWARISGKTDPASAKWTDAELDAWFPALPMRKLNKQDYEKIRAATDWLFERGASASYEQFAQHLDDTVFDPRFKVDPGALKAIENVPAEDVINMLNANAAAGLKAEECRNALGEKFADCSLSWSVAQLTGGHGANSVQLNLTVEGAGVKKVFGMYLGHKSNSLSPWVESGRTLYQIYLLPVDLNGKRVGDRFSLVTLNFSPNGTSADNVGQLRFDSMAVTQSVLAKIWERESAVELPGGSKSEICYQPMASRSANPWDNNFTAALKGLNPNIATLKIDIYKDPQCFPKYFVTGVAD